MALEASNKHCTNYNKHLIYDNIQRDTNSIDKDRDISNIGRDRDRYKNNQGQCVSPDITTSKYLSNYLSI
jgi:hypothetical protein